jgi:ATP-dependent Clp protease ATP-binding subunit ClpC
VNRIDHLVPFDVLSEDALAEIARLLLAQALEREGLTRRGVQVELDDAVVAHVVARGYDPRYGARPMKRAVEAEVIVPLARALAASGVGGDAAAAPSIGRVRLEVVDGAVAVRGVG